MNLTYPDVAGLIDHALLQPTLTVEELDAGIRLARAYEVASVCIMPYRLRRCAELLSGTGVRPSTTIGFPHGGHTTSTKVQEARQALADGGVELDMVVNVSSVLSGSWQSVTEDIAAVLEVAHGGGAAIKVIFETCYLSDPQKIRLCEICGELGADWIKTSTGFGPGGATREDLALMRRHAPPSVQIKASGGVRDLDTVLEVRQLGVSRVGASRTAAILGELRMRLGLPPIEPPTRT